MIECIVCGGAGRFLYQARGHDVFRCRSCGFGFVHPLPTAEELAGFYARTYYDSDEYWGYHTEYGALETGLKKTYGRFLHALEKRHPGRRFERVLDVGCAYGFFLDTVAERWGPEQLVGLDVTPEAERLVQDKGYEFHRGFVEQVELPKEHFDLVFMGDAFEHVQDPRAVADKLASVLAPGGVLIITTVDFDAWIPRLFGRRWRLMTPPEHLQFWNRRSLGRLFRDRGLLPRIERYWLYYPRVYVEDRFRRQFGFPPFFLSLYPGDPIPVPSLDVLIGFFDKPVVPRR